MFGALLPDLNRLELFVPAETVRGVLSVAFSWSPFHRVGGTVVVILTGVLLAPARLRRGVSLLLSLDAVSHYLLDFFLYKPSGLSGPCCGQLLGKGLHRGVLFEFG